MRRILVLNLKNLPKLNNLRTKKYKEKVDRYNDYVKPDDYTDLSKLKFEQDTSERNINVENYIKYGNS